jgi:AcrR family transcriptional regulator
MTTSPTIDTRARLLASTEQLIYASGIGATGMDQIVKVSGVARKSIYRYFPTKEALVAAALTQRDERWMGWFEAASPPGGTLGQRVAAMFAALENWFGTPDFRGCAFINAAGEIGDASDVIRQVAKAHKDRLFAYLRGAVREAGVADAAADELARQLLILIDGAITVALVAGDKSAAPRAARMALTLISASPH